MKRVIYSIVSLLATLPLVAQAGNFGPFNFNFGPGDAPSPYQMVPPGGYSFRPYGPSNARGMLPPGYPGSAPYGYTQQPQAQQEERAPPRLEVEVSNSRPYVQENIILTLRVVSSTNIDKVDPVFPQNQYFAVQALTDPSASTRMVDGQPQIVNTMRYMVTPLLMGQQDLPVSVTVESSEGGYTGSNAITLRPATPLRLDALPPVADVTPWLPLEQLAITSNMDVPPEVEAGKPVSLVLKLSAAGAIGSQLPSLERLLKSTDFRVYRERTELEGGLSQNTRHIMGTRTEHFTLVPQYGGMLRLPSLRITWFNVTTGTVEHTSLPIRTLAAAGKSGALERFFHSNNRSLFPPGYASAFWLPLTGVLLLLAGYWIGVWYKGREGHQGPSPVALVTALGHSAAAASADRARRLGRRLSPRRHWGRAIARGANLLPTSLRLWFWVRCANEERDPGLWCKTLLFLSCRQLALSPYAPLPEMAEKLIELQPGSDPQQVRQLFRQLDGAIYGNNRIDFEQWKGDLTRQVRPGIPYLRGRGRKSRNKAGRLPDLNPKAA
jgi:hypothetical protein